MYLFKVEFSWSKLNVYPNCNRIVVAATPGEAVDLCLKESEPPNYNLIEVSKLSKVEDIGNIEILRN